MTHSLVLGTTNTGKVRELAALLAPFGIGSESLAGLPAAVDVEALGRWVLAEDSGLVVPALGGAPGVFSARFAGAVAGEPRAVTDGRNNALLLERLAGLQGQKRAAAFVCHAALADPAGRIVAVAAGSCGGLIGEAPAGAGGFGYDPLFIVPEYHRSFGELAPAVKGVISHRGRALRALLPAISAALSGPG